MTGSASPSDPPTHSGAGRIVRVRLRPMTLAERGVAAPTVSLARLLHGEQTTITGRSEISLGRYVDEILRSGFPGIHDLSQRMARAQLDGYLERIVDRDFDALGHQVRRPATLRRWMQAYAAATATTASFETIRDAASGERGEKPTRATTQPYRDVLERLWILDPVPAWLPTRNRLARLSSPAKHHLADPALAAQLLEVDADALLHAQPAGPPIPRDGRSWAHCLNRSSPFASGSTHKPPSPHRSPANLERRPRGRSHRRARSATPGHRGQAQPGRQRPRRPPSPVAARCARREPHRRHHHYHRTRRLPAPVLHRSHPRSPTRP